MRLFAICAIAAACAVSQATVFTFSSGSIVIPAIGTTTPSPIVFNASSIDGPIVNVTISFQGLSHTFPDDIGAVLFNPSNTSALLFDGPGDDVALSNVTWLFSDAGASTLLSSGINPSGTYKAGQNEWNSVFTGAPVGPYGTTFSAFNGSGNGNWNLFIQDFEAGDGGTINNVDLTITTNPVPEPATMIGLGLGAVALLRKRSKK